jgi:chromosome segregation ATPase
VYILLCASAGYYGFMAEITKTQLRDELAAARSERNTLESKLRDERDARRASERESTIAAMRSRDVRTGIEEARQRVLDLLQEFNEARDRLVALVIELEVPPDTSGHDTMNDFIRSHGGWLDRT